jgi:hypothetical protein
MITITITITITIHGDRETLGAKKARPSRRREGEADFVPPGTPMAVAAVSSTRVVRADSLRRGGEDEDREASQASRGV